MQEKVVRGCFFEKMKRLSSILWSEVLEWWGVPQVDENFNKISNENQFIF